MIVIHHLPLKQLDSLLSKHYFINAPRALCEGYDSLNVSSLIYIDRLHLTLTVLFTKKDKLIVDTNFKNADANMCRMEWCHSSGS